MQVLIFLFACVRLRRDRANVQCAGADSASRQLRLCSTSECLYARHPTRALTPPPYPFQGAGFFAECVTVGWCPTPQRAPPSALLLTPPSPSSYDLFVIDGVTSMLNGLGPAQPYKYTYLNNMGKASSLTSYFTYNCAVPSVACMPYLYQNSTEIDTNTSLPISGGFTLPNPASTWQDNYSPVYQLQTADLKNAVRGWVGGGFLSFRLCPDAHSTPSPHFLFR